MPNSDLNLGKNAFVVEKIIAEKICGEDKQPLSSEMFWNFTWN